MIHVNARAIIERETANGTDILLQSRSKPGERVALELPGGRIEPYEPVLTALRREVREETGLTITAVAGQETRVVSDASGTDFAVECLRPFSVYQTLRGPVDSFGVYFRCRAEGTLLAHGDQTQDARWYSVSEISAMLRAEPRRFSDIDRAGIELYVKDR